MSLRPPVHPLGGLDTPTPAGSSSSTALQTLGRMRATASSRPPPRREDSGAIAVDPAEQKRRGVERRVQQNVDGGASSSDDDGFDVHSARFGDGGVRRAGGLRGDDLDDDLSIQIPMRHGAQPARDVTDDLSSLSFSRTLSPRRPSPDRTRAQRSMAAQMTHDSPVSGFEGMARELRKEFERITASGYGVNATTLGGGAGQTSQKLGSPHAHTARRIFGHEISNTIATSSPPPAAAHHDRSERAWTLPPAPTPAPVRQRPLSPPPPIPAPMPQRARTHPAPVRPRSPVYSHRMPDITGLTEGLASPEKQRLNRAEDENELSAANLNRLNDPQLARPTGVRQRSPDHDSGFGGSSGSHDNHKHTRRGSAPDWLVGEQKARAELESLVHRLRSHVHRLAHSLATHAEAIDELRSHARHGDVGEVATVQRAIEMLTGEVDEVRKLTESLLAERRADALRQVDARERARQASEATRSPPPPRSPAMEPARRMAPQPSPRNESALERELRRAEEILSSVPREHHPDTCALCRDQRRASESMPDVPPRTRSAPPRSDPAATRLSSSFIHRAPSPLPQQAVLARILRDLEDDFASHKAIFIELSEAYKIMDPASDAQRRRTLAEHLKESIDVLEQKADQIKRLYDLLHCDPSQSLPPHAVSAADFVRRRTTNI